MEEQSPQLILMGVSGSGKTAVGLELAEMTGWDFHDADDFHSSENKEKMRNGIPLTDADREPWLKSLHELLARYAREGKPMILACSALKRRYREILAEGFPQIRFVYLKGSFETFKRRMERRENHYMKPGMLESQFETLEEPHPDEEDAITVDAALGTPGELAGEVYRRISICF
ncbi:MAG: gluconokinase [Spirochaetota bacterium]